MENYVYNEKALTKGQIKIKKDAVYHAFLTICTIREYKFDGISMML